jgi:predicted membrane-bound spermidine synthase
VKLIAAKGGEVYATAEDDVAAVVAGRADGDKQIWVAGTSMTALTVDTEFMPLLPLAMRPSATRGLVIAFGMGTAFRTSLLAGVRTDAVELVPSVPQMFRWFYPDAAAVAANPLGSIIIADGRNHVELSASTYDFIVVDPPPPLESSGVSVISSLEFYRASKSRLAPGGVMVQWVPFGQTQSEFLAHVRTFLRVFPNVGVVAGAGGNGFYMLGSDSTVELTAPAIEAVLARPGLLDEVNAAPDSGDRTAQAWGARLAGLTWAAGEQLRAAVGDGPLVTDDRPLPEYYILRRITEQADPPLTLDGLRSLLR